METQETTRRARRQELRRQQILEAAAAVFARVGYGPATLDAIGQEVGLSKTSLYYYVASKEELLASLVVAAIEAIEAGFAQRRPPAADPAGELEAFVAAHVAVALTQPGQVVCHNLDFVFRDGTDEAMLAARRRHEATLRGILEQGVAAGRLRPMDTRTTTALILAALNTVPLWARPADRAEAIAGQAARLVLDGVRAG